MWTCKMKDLDYDVMRVRGARTRTKSLTSCNASVLNEAVFVIPYFQQISHTSSDIDSKEVTLLVLINSQCRVFVVGF